MLPFLPEARYSYEQAARIERRWQGIISLLLAALVGLIAFALTALVAEKLRPSRLALLPVGLLVGIIIVQMALVREAVLFVWVASITYYRNYFIYSHPDEAQGLYWIPSDIPLVMLVIVWLMEGMRQRKLVQGEIGWAWIAILPFMGSYLIEITTSPRPDWVVWEVIKTARGLLILVLIPAFCRPRDWWVVILGCGAGVVAQALLGISQVALRRAAFVLEGETIVRAAGTMMHPNALASYFLVCVPVLIALGLGATRPVVRWPSLAAGLIGFGGLLATQSRTPAVLFALQVLIILFFLLARRRISPKWLLGVGSILILMGVVAATPFADKIMKRISGNWKESVDFRVKTNDFAYKLFEKNQWTGVGPGHFTRHMVKFSPTYAKLYKDNVKSSKETNVRYILAVHNAYLLVMAEGGLLGFWALIWMLSFGLVLGVRAIYYTSGEVQIACWGLTVGLLGIYGQGMTEYMMVTDLGLMPMLLVMALLSCAPRLFGARPGHSELTI